MLPDETIEYFEMKCRILWWLPTEASGCGLIERVRFRRTKEIVRLNWFHTSTIKRKYKTVYKSNR